MSKVCNDDLIRAIFTAPDEVKTRALAILEGRDGSPSRPLDNGPLLLSMGEAAGLLGVSRATLWRMLRAGRLTKVEIYSGAFRLRKADLLCLVRGKGAGGETE
jgi:excisionase family DNA binding protein